MLSALGTIAIFRGMVRGAHEPLRRSQSLLRHVQGWIQVNIEAMRALGLVAGGVTVLLLVLQLTLRAPHQSSRSWEAGLHEAIRAAAPYADRGRPIFVTGDVLYLPAHLNVALRRDPRGIGAVVPYLPFPWNQCGEGPLSPSALWDRRGGSAGPAVFLTRPGEIPDQEPEIRIQGPTSLFSGPAEVLWDIHVGLAAQTALEPSQPIP